MNKIILTLISILLITQLSVSQNSNASVSGKITDKKENVSYASVFLKGTNIGTSTNIKGEYSIKNIKPGSYTLQVQAVGYKPYSKKITLENNRELNLDIFIETDVLGLEEVVVTGNRSKIARKKASSIVNVINEEIFQATQAVTLSGGLNFSPGLRMENDCQNCGFSQIRMNGLEGPYSQILINSRPIFSGLAGVYGLELIPSNMIERVEVIRGGGSALYGSNAIAGTINLLLKDPTQNSYELNLNNSFIGLDDAYEKTATDYSVSFNASVVGKDNKNGVSIYGFHRNRKPFDANNDSFSEIALMKNVTIGTRLFQKLGTRAKATIDFFHINEKRRGGNKFDVPNHVADISEALEHRLTTGALTFEQYYRENDMLSVFVAGQKVNRDSYYGAEQSLADYGNTKDFTFNTGIQYNAKFTDSELIVGVEDTYSTLKDTKLGYLDIENAVIVNNVIKSIPYTKDKVISNQKVNTVGIFSQYDIRLNKVKLSVGGRLDSYTIEDKQNDKEKKSKSVFSPRVTFLYNVMPSLQARLSYSAGYRAPQIFDEDLHIETSGAKKVIHKNSPNLKQETSNSYMLSFDYNESYGSSSFGFLLEGFYTKLNNPFAPDRSEPDANGVVTYTRVNAEKGAYVRGANIELNYIPLQNLKIKAGFTIQESKYNEAQDFNEKKFLRTPNNYGFFIVDWEPIKSWDVIASGNYTGSMLVAYGEDELRKSKEFMDVGLKFIKNIPINNNKLELSAGFNNLFNSFQKDFDKGVNRDPAYIYGPFNPRTVYFGIKFGSL